MVAMHKKVYKCLEVFAKSLHIVNHCFLPVLSSK